MRWLEYKPVWRGDIIYRRLERGLDGRIFYFIKSFLKTSTFRVGGRSSLLTRCGQRNGVPQGSVLSITLFFVTINVLADNIDPSIFKTQR